ncbi:hypothetical protein NM688_g860 [Phlebia brevispora]|uniref:Uncharacterized protein n=1 Tax=Phlebia brevispora TaxID=194682 RepID=A0ACC1TDG9_9APHY|nr:hypothetical protein NM688_g860 [Phlebia brevispora]
MPLYTQPKIPIARPTLALNGLRTHTYTRGFATLRRPTVTQIQSLHKSSTAASRIMSKNISGSSSTNGQESMVAFRFAPGWTEPHRSELSIPMPQPNEVVIKVLAGGLCHSDVGASGHEGAGEVIALGSNVAATHPDLKVGSYIAVFGPNACFEASCKACSTGKDNLCPNAVWIGLGRDGSWADYMALPASSCVPVPGTTQEISPAVVAVATDAVLTPYHALKTCSKVQPGQTVLCLGVGGLGLNAVAIAKNCLNAGTVIACDMRHSSLNQALEVGADLALTPEALEGYLKEHSISIDVVADFCGTQHTFDLSSRVVAPGGIVHIVGLMQPKLEITPLEMMAKDMTVKVSFWGTKQELVEVLQAVKDGKVKPHVEERPLVDCEKVIEEMKAGHLRSRVALIPSH